MVHSKFVVSAPFIEKAHNQIQVTQAVVVFLYLLVFDHLIQYSRFISVSQHSYICVSVCVLSFDQTENDRALIFGTHTPLNYI